MVGRRRAGTVLTSALVAFALSAGATAASGSSLDPASWSTAGRTTTRTAWNGRSGVEVVDFASMRRVWRLGGGSWSAPIMFGGTVVAADNRGSFRASLVAVGLSTGAVRWSVDFGPQLVTKVGPPSTDGSRVFVTVARYHGGTTWRYDLYAYSLNTGAQLWTAQLGVMGRFVSLRPALPDNGYVYAMSVNAPNFLLISRYRASDGRLQWTARPGVGLADIAVGGGSVWASTSNGVERYDLDTGEQLDVPVSEGPVRTFSIAGPDVFVAGPRGLQGWHARWFQWFWKVNAATNCEPRLRVVTPRYVIASQVCTTGAAPPIVVERSNGLPGLRLQGAQPGDVPLSAGTEVLLGMSAKGALKAWNLKTGAALAAPVVSGVISTANFGGPVLAYGRMVVPQQGWLEAYAP